MALPNLGGEISFIKIKLPSGKSIGVRGWKVKDEKELLFTLDSEQNQEEKKVTHIWSFLRGCVEDQKIFDCLGEQDVKKIAIETRKLAKGDGVEYNYACPYCKKKLFSEVKLSTGEVTKAFDPTPLIVNDDLVVSFKEISFKKSDELAEKYKDSQSKYVYYVLLNSIEAITFKGETYSTFTEADIEEAFDTLESNDLNKITSAFKEKQSYVDLQHQVVCLHCAKEINVDFGELLSFLAL